MSIIKSTDITIIDKTTSYQVPTEGGLDIDRYTIFVGKKIIIYANRETSGVHYTITDIVANVLSRKILVYVIPV